jgi:probable HAF family extracellular repeat protein
MYCRLPVALATVCIFSAGLSLGAAASAQANLLVDLGTVEGVGINNGGEVALTTGIYSNGTFTAFPTNFTGLAINANGLVVGFTGFHAGLYNKGTVTDLGVLPGADPTVDGSTAFGINTGGQIVGFGAERTGTPLDGFIYSNGAMTDMGRLPGLATGVSSAATGINDAGLVSGVALDTVAIPSSYFAVTYDNGTWTKIGYGEGFAINATGQVTGILSSVPENAVILPTSPVSNNNNGLVGHAFIYNNGTATDLGTLPGGTTSTGLALNAGARIVGLSDLTGSSTTHAFFYNGVMNDMNALISATDPLQPYVTLTDAHGINDTRLILVNGIDSRTQLEHAYLLQGPWLDVAPGPLAFPSQTIGTASSAQLVSLTNSGPTLMTLGAISTSGNFNQTNNCGTSLASNGSCTVMVTFGPTAAGDLTGALTVISTGVPIAIPLAGIAPIQVAIASSAATTIAEVPVKLTWTVSPGASCTATGGSTADGWIGTVALSGTQSVTESTAGTYPYGLSCTAGSQSQANQTSVIVTWPVVSVSLTALPASFTAGQSIALKWSATNATSCTATGGGAGDTWPGTLATSGSVTLTEPYAPATPSLTLTYTLKCTSSVSGLSATTSAKSVENAVVPPAPTPAAKSGGGGALDLLSLLVLTGVAALIRLRPYPSKWCPTRFCVLGRAIQCWTLPATE